MAYTLTFSIIIPLCHRGQLLRKALASLGRLDFPPEEMEVLISGPVDDDDSRRTVETEAASARFPIRYVSSYSPSRPAALNAACTVARGKYLVFLDDDCFAAQDWLTRLMETLENEPNVGVVGGVDELIGGSSSFDLALDSILGSSLATGGCRRGTGTRVAKYYPKLWNMAMPRQVALEIATKRGSRTQVFDETLTVYEDVDLADRAECLDKRLVFAPRVRVSHRRETTFLETLRRDFDMARTCRVLRVHRLPHSMLVAAVLTALVLLVLTPLFSACGVALLVGLGIYSLLLATVAAQGFLRTRQPVILLLIPALMVSLHAARAFGYILGRWRPDRTAG